MFALSKAFKEHFGFLVVGTDSDGNVTSMINEENQDDFSFDCSYSNLELSLGKCDNLHDVKARFDQ